jgi:uncharacterized membrane-anchored protein
MEMKDRFPLVALMVLIIVTLMWMFVPFANFLVPFMIGNMLETTIVFTMIMTVIASFLIITYLVLDKKKKINKNH